MQICYLVASRRDRRTGPGQPQVTICTESRSERILRYVRLNENENQRLDHVVEGALMIPIGFQTYKFPLPPLYMHIAHHLTILPQIKPRLLPYTPLVEFWESLCYSKCVSLLLPPSSLWLVLLLVVPRL